MERNMLKFLLLTFSAVNQLRTQAYDMEHNRAPVAGEDAEDVGIEIRNTLMGHMEYSLSLLMNIQNLRTNCHKNIKFVAMEGWGKQTALLLLPQCTVNYGKIGNKTRSSRL
jgi:hypothetical protein